MDQKTHKNNISSLVVIYNITKLTTKDIELYCKKYDKNIVCLRRKYRYNREYINILFSSDITIKHFLNDRPHFIRECRINTSLLSDALCGPNFVCVQIDKNALITEDCLYKYASETFGRVVNCVFYDVRGYGFIEFYELADAQRARSSSNLQINGFPIKFRPRNSSNKMLSPFPLIKLVHIGNFSSQDQDKIQYYFPNIQNFSVYKNCFGQTYILGSFSIADSIQLLRKRAFCLNGRVLNIFVDDDDRFTKCDNYLLVRNVPYRLNDYNLLGYFSQYGRILNCYRYGQTDAYRIQYRDKLCLDRVLQFNRIHVIKNVQIQIERQIN